MLKPATERGGNGGSCNLFFVLIKGGKERGGRGPISIIQKGLNDVSYADRFADEGGKGGEIKIFSWPQGVKWEIARLHHSQVRNKKGGFTVFKSNKKKREARHISLPFSRRGGQRDLVFEKKGLRGRADFFG